jgi:thiol-disulfide isomerase/thioredoxin
MKQVKRYGLVFLCILLFFSSFFPTVQAEKSTVVLNFYYSESCGSCMDDKQLILEEFKNNDAYDDIVTVYIKDIDKDIYYEEWSKNYTLFPIVVISNNYKVSNVIDEFQISFPYINQIINEFRLTEKIIPIVNSSTVLRADLFTSDSCSQCDEFISSFNNLEQNYSTNFSFQVKNIDQNESYSEEYEEIRSNNNSLLQIPFLVLRNNNSMVTIIERENLTSSVNTLSDVFLEYVKKIDPQKDTSNIINTPFGPIDTEAWSLPVLTVILGGIDSFNPCAFFILIFLLNLLIYAKSRKRMLLIGGIFIFFSGLLYMIFMFFLYGLIFQLKSQIFLFTILVAGIVIPMGLLNIKDFFFFKKGASLSIPDSKKPKIYKKMRNLVKHPKLSATILGTIMLAVTVNFYELLCTLGLPLAYTSALSENSVVSSSAAYYVYILLYNVVYVIPLFIILLVFVITLGKRKLSEWHGQIMKLVSGIMLSSFGFIFLIDYQLLENPITPIILLSVSLGVTGLISMIYKKFVGIPDEINEE